MLHPQRRRNNYSPYSINLNGKTSIRWRLRKSKSLSRHHLSLSHPDAVSLSSYISRRPKSPSAASSSKTTMSDESRLFSTSVEISINRRSIIPLSRNFVLPYFSPPPSFGITCSHQSHKSLPRPTSSATCSPDQS
ncbi:hypothetical protein EV2_015466 [Malus domestica]